MQISFYVLGNRYASHGDASNVSDDSSASAINPEAVLNFVCKLTQTVLKKSEQSLIIVDSNSKRLQKLDKHLWDFDATSFIPHNLHLTPSKTGSGHQNTDSKMSANNASNDGNGNSPEDISLKDSQIKKTQADKPVLQASMLTAPVSLVSILPESFDGVVLNLAAKPIRLPNDSVKPERILEIITPDELSKQQGREKYRYYQSLGYKLLYFPIN